jgi:hypothetical protein
VEHLQSISDRILKQNEVDNVTFIGQPARATVNRNTVRFQPRRDDFEGRRVFHLPSEEAQSLAFVARDDKALLSVIHAESTHHSSAIYALHAKQAGRIGVPVFELR